MIFRVCKYNKKIFLEIFFFYFPENYSNFGLIKNSGQIAAEYKQL